jgi:rhodanese-related sulfurtransferase
LADIADPGLPHTTVDTPGEVWVYCGGGFRAAIAASLLDAAGARVTLIDQPYATAEQARLTVRDTPPEDASRSRSDVTRKVR